MKFRCSTPVDLADIRAHGCLAWLSCSSAVDRWQVVRACISTEVVHTLTLYHSTWYSFSFSPGFSRYQNNRIFHPFSGNLKSEISASNHQIESELILSKSNQIESHKNTQILPYSPRIAKSEISAPNLDNRISNSTLFPVNCQI